MRKVILLLSALSFFNACNMKSAKLKEEIEKKEKSFTEDSQKGNYDTAVINSLLRDYETYSSSFPDDTTGAMYLFKAADFYRYLHQPLRSIELYKKVYKQYPGLSKRPMALFIQGFVFENDLQNLHAAKGIYETFLREYPNHPMAKDVTITLANLGKSPEEIMQGFQEKAAQDSLAKAEK